MQKQFYLFLLAFLGQQLLSMERPLRIETNKNCAATNELKKLLKLSKKSDTNFFNEIERLIALNADVNIAGIKGETPLMRAVKFKQLRIAELLIKAGANVNATDGERETALRYAVLTNNVSMVQLLIDSGSNINDINDKIQSTFSGSTALIYATRFNYPRLVRLLVKAEADVNIQDDGQRYTALMYSARHGSCAMVSRLLQAGANKSLVNGDNKTALDIACENPKEDIVNILTLSKTKMP